MLGINAIAQKAKPFIKQFEYTINAGFGTTASSDPYDNAIINWNAGIDIKRDILSISKSKKSRIYGLLGVHYTQRGGKNGTGIEDMITYGNSFRVNQVNVPLHIGYKHVFKNNNRFFVDIGPFIGFNSKCDLGDGYGEDRFNSEYKLESKSVEFGLGGNIGFCLKRFGISMGYDSGLTNIAKFSNKNSYYNNTYDLKSQVFYFRLQWTINKI